MRGDLERASEVLPSIPKEHHNRCVTFGLAKWLNMSNLRDEYVSWILIISSLIDSVAHFLESRGMIEDAIEVATDPDYRFELAIQLGRLEVAKVYLFPLFLRGYE